MRVLILALLLAACAHAPVTPPEPVVRTVEVKVPVPVTCKALDDLGAEPVYPDTDAALAATTDLFKRVSLLVRGRLLRAARLAQYIAAKASC